MEKCSVQIFDKIKTSKNLPSLPQILIKLVDLCWNDDSKFQDIAQIIQVDASLSARVMSMVGAFSHGQQNGTPDITNALEALGKNAVKNIVFSAANIQVFRKKKDYSVFRLKDFWRHSLMCAVLSGLIAENMGYPSAAEAYLTGLLHDVGKLVLWVNFPEEYADVLTSSQYRREFLLEAERRHGVTHCQTGAWLIRNWNLQSFMADAVLYHHEPPGRILNALPLIKIIYVADALCTESNQKNAHKFDLSEKVLGIKPVAAEKIIRRAEKEVERKAQALDLDLVPPDGSATAAAEIEFKKQEDLARKTRDITLVQGICENLLAVRDETSILKVVHQSLSAFFEVRQVLFFLYESDKNKLLGKSLLPNTPFDIINEVTIPIKEEKSLLVRALRQARSLDSFRDLPKNQQTIIDEQIIRLIGTDGILCLPMTAFKNFIGVIVLGVKKTRFSGLAEKTTLFMMVANHAAQALYANNLRQHRISTARTEHLPVWPTLARKVAHEVNTPLSIIKNYIAVLRRKLPDNESFREELKIINEEIDCVAHTVRELSDASENNARPNKPLDVNDLLSSLIRIFQQSLLLDSNVNARLSLDPSLPKVMTDKNRMRQIFHNLIINAVEAMPGGGNLDIRTRHVFDYVDEDKKLMADSTLGHAEITITDDGPGIVDTVKSNLFKPFVTSKGAGHAGLGLSIVYNNVKELKGIITSRNETGKGAGFKIVFPITHNRFS